MSSSSSYHWSPDNYISLVEHTQYPMLKRFQEEEAIFIQKSITNHQQKTLIDVGAGYGRLLPVIKNAGTTIAVELDNNLFKELKKRSMNYKNVQPIQGDANSLSMLLKNLNITKPVVLCLQNSLGTWVGDYKTALSEMKKVAQGGELIISLFCQEGLKTEGIPMYQTLIPLVGKPDLEATDIKNGVFRSKNGYESQWWTKQQREQIKTLIGGSVTNEFQTKNYYFLHVKYA